MSGQAFPHVSILGLRRAEHFPIKCRKSIRDGLYKCTRNTYPMFVPCHAQFKVKYQTSQPNRIILTCFQKKRFRARTILACTRASKINGIWPSSRRFMSWLLFSNRHLIVPCQGLRIDIQRLTKDTIEFDLIGVDASIANAFRRILVAEVGFWFRSRTETAR